MLPGSDVPALDRFAVGPERQIDQGPQPVLQTRRDPQRRTTTSSSRTVPSTIWKARTSGRDRSASETIT